MELSSAVNVFIFTHVLLEMISEVLFDCFDVMCTLLSLSKLCIPFETLYPFHQGLNQTILHVVGVTKRESMDVWISLRQPGVAVN